MAQSRALFFAFLVTRISITRPLLVRAFVSRHCPRARLHFTSSRCERTLSAVISARPCRSMAQRRDTNLLVAICKRSHLRWHRFHAAAWFRATASFRARGPTRRASTATIRAPRFGLPSLAVGPGSCCVDAAARSALASRASNAPHPPVPCARVVDGRMPRFAGRG